MLNDKINIIRSDSSVRWSTDNPILSDGEIGYVTDLSKVKYGDGITKWNDLAFPAEVSDGRVSTINTGFGVAGGPIRSTGEMVVNFDDIQAIASKNTLIEKTYQSSSRLVTNVTIDYDGTLTIDLSLSDTYIIKYDKPIIRFNFINGPEYNKEKKFKLIFQNLTEQTTIWPEYVYWPEQIPLIPTPSPTPTPTPTPIPAYCSPQVLSTTSKFNVDPVSIVYNSRYDRIFISNQSGNSVLSIKTIGETIDITTGNVIQVGTAPSGMVLDDEESYLFIANKDSNSVSVIDCANNSALFRIPSTGRGTCSVAYNPLNKKVYASNSISNNISIIDYKNQTVSGLIEVGQEPTFIIHNKKLDYLYCANSSSNSIMVIDCSNNVIINEMAVAGRPSAMAIDQLNNRLYVASTENNTISIINLITNVIVSTAIVGGQPENILYVPETKVLYVSNKTSNAVTLVSGVVNRPISYLQVGQSPSGIAYNKKSNVVYVANQISQSISILNDCVPESPINPVPTPTPTLSDSIWIGSGGKIVIIDPETDAFKAEILTGNTGLNRMLYCPSNYLKSLKKKFKSE
jgi:YVTN family beta-propeller protein